VPSWLNYVLRYLLGQFVPVIVQWIYNTARQMQIEAEVDKEHREFEIVKKQAQEWLKKNPGKELPKDIENQLRDLARKRLRGLQ
jgi:hypothetical protein